MRRFFNKNSRRLALAAVVIGLVAGLAYAATAILYPSGTELSTVSSYSGAVDGDNAAKGKMLYLQYETSMGTGIYEDVQLCIYGDSLTAPGTNTAWSFDGTEYDARDIFVTRSTDGGQTWSQPACISVNGSGQNFAGQSTASGDPDGLLGPIISQAYPGDCGKPQVFASTQTGKNVVVSFISSYDMNGGGASQGVVEYPEFGGISRPFHAVYTVKSTDGGATWGVPQQLSDMTRDAKQITVKGTGAGFAMAWQEDPLGLQPGQAEGPGEGGSGAKASQGTDCWYTSIKKADFAGSPWPPAVRITDNAIQIKDGADNGPERSTRPQLAIVGPTAVYAYEEVKGLEKFDTGKYIRYHTFPAFGYVGGVFATTQTHASSTHDFAIAGDVTNGQGWIVSKPDENARRVRIVFQGTPGTTTGQVLCFIYKQGLYDQGGPSDIMCRMGIKDTTADPNSTGLRPEDLVPGINFSSTATYPLPKGLASGSDRELAGGNAPATNLSSRLGLTAGTDGDNLEDARAHRGVMVGDQLAIGYTWTDDQALARYTDLRNYNFYIRRTFDGGQTWDGPRNISNLPDTTLSVREPRMVKCPKPKNPAETQATLTYIVAWGTHVNEYEHLSTRTLNRDLYITRTQDFGNNYDPVQNLTNAVNTEDENQESQIRPNADGSEVYINWMRENHTTGKMDVIYATGVLGNLPSSGDGGDDDEGCSTGSGTGGSWLLLVGLASLVVVAQRRWRVRATRS